MIDFNAELSFRDNNVLCNCSRRGERLEMTRSLTETTGDNDTTLLITQSHQLMQ